MSLIAIMSLMIIVNSSFALASDNMSINTTINETLNISDFNLNNTNRSGSNITYFNETNFTINNTINQTNTTYDLMPPQRMPRYKKKYTSINQINKIYSADNVLDINKGTVSVWMYMQKNYPRRDHLIFQTDDSRLALYFDTFYSKGARKSITRIAARAGGTHRAIDSSYTGGNFPEASIIINNDGSLSNYGSTIDWYSPAKMPEGEWNLVTMTWDGYPEGIVKIYLNGRLIGQKKYDSRYDDSRPLFKTFAVGYRPREWKGEIVIKNGVVYEGVPKTEMKLVSGGLKIKDMRIYKDILSKEEILSLYNKGFCNDCNITEPKEIINTKINTKQKIIEKNFKYKLINDFAIKNKEKYEKQIVEDKQNHTKNYNNTEEKISPKRYIQGTKNKDYNQLKKVNEKNSKIIKGVNKRDNILKDDKKEVKFIYEDEDGCKGGCKLDDKCVSYGLRFKNGKATYCDTDGQIKEQKKENEQCQNNFECESNSCSSGKCVDLVKQVEKNANLLNKIMSWLSNIF